MQRDDSGHSSSTVRPQPDAPQLPPIGERSAAEQIRSGDDTELRDRIDDYARAVHRSLDLETTAFAIAAEARRFIGCDRVTIAVRRGTRYRTLAVSGQETINRRSNVIRCLERLLRDIAPTAEPTAFPVTNDILPARIQKRLDDYILESRATNAVFWPLLSEVPAHETDQPAIYGDAPAEVSAVLIAERFSGKDLWKTDHERLEVATAHAGLAMNRAIEHQRIFLLPLWKALGRLTWIARARNLPRTLIALILLTAITLTLTIVPADFDLHANGTLQPQTKRNIFASTPGTVASLHVGHQSHVEPGDPLVDLRNTDFNVELERVEGRTQVVGKRLQAINASLLTASRVDPGSRGDDMEAEREELESELASLAKQHELLLELRDQLTLRSPIKGEVITWNVRETLSARPVKAGDQLLTVADLNGPWIVELLLPDRRAGHLLSAREEITPDLAVSFVPAMNPELTLEGTIKDVARVTSHDELAGPVVAVRVAIDHEALGEPVPGSTVSGKIHCGRRSLGYVWLHEAIEWIQTRILFRL